MRPFPYNSCKGPAVSDSCFARGMCVVRVTIRWRPSPLPGGRRRCPGFVPEGRTNVSDSSSHKGGNSSLLEMTVGQQIPWEIFEGCPVLLTDEHVDLAIRWQPWNLLAPAFQTRSQTVTIYRVINRDPPTLDHHTRLSGRHKRRIETGSYRRLARQNMTAPGSANDR